MRWSGRIALQSIVALCLALQFGCAGGARVESMTVETELDLDHRFSDAVSLRIMGGSETKDFFASRIGNDEFALALRQSIEQSRLFSAVVTEELSRVHIDVMLVRTEEPIAAANVPVTLEANWRLTRQADKEVLWERVIISDHTASVWRSISGPHRFRYAKEGAAQDNIAQALLAISKLDLAADSSK